MPSRGFTLLECLIAVTVLAVGILALVSTAAPVARLVRWGGAESVAAAAATAQMEALRAGGCDAPAAGEFVRGGRYRLEWTVETQGALRRIAVSATYPRGTSAQRDVFETVIACPP